MAHRTQEKPLVHQITGLQQRKKKKKECNQQSDEEKQKEGVGKGHVASPSLPLFPVSHVH